MDTLGRYSGIASEVLGGFSGYNQKIGTKKRKSTAKHQIQFAYRPRQSIVAHRPSVAKPQGHRVSVKPLATTGKHRGSMAVKTMSQSTVLKPAMNSRTGSMWTSGTGPSRRHLRLKSNAQVDNFKAFEDLKEGEISEIQDIADREIHIRLIEIWNHLIDQKGILTCEKYQLLGTQISQLTKIPVAATITTPSISFKCFTTRILLESARFTGSEKPQDQTKFLNDLDVAISDALTIDGELVKKAWTVLSKQRKRYHAMLYQNAIHKAFGSNVNSRTPETYVEFTKRISKLIKKQKTGEPYNNFVNRLTEALELEIKIKDATTKQDTKLQPTKPAKKKYSIVQATLNRAKVTYRPKLITRTHKTLTAQRPKVQCPINSVCVKPIEV